MARKGRKISGKNEEKLFDRLLSKDQPPPILSPFRAKYFLCSNSCKCLEENDNLRDDETSHGVNKNSNINIINIISLNCWDSLLHPLEIYVTSSNCLSPLTLKALLHSIKIIEDTMICFRLIDILKIHNQHHPPCRRNMNEYYENVLLKAFNNKTDDFSNYCFKDLIDDINKVTDHLIKVETKYSKEGKNYPFSMSPRKNRSKHNKELKENFDEHNIMTTPKSRKSRLPLTVQDLESRINLYAKCGDFSSLPEFSLKGIQEDKLILENKAQRLFLAFQLILDILEQDLFIWLMKFHGNYSEKLHNSLSWPLIANIVWQDDLSNIGRVNDHCKEIFFIFQKCPSKYKSAISRYICLISAIARLSEDNQELRFPSFGEKCEEFSKTMAICISDKSSNEELIEMVEVIFPHWLKFIVLSYLLDANLSSPSIYSLLSVLRILQRNLTNRDTLTSRPNTKENKRSKKNKANVRNHFGETVLHKLCRNNQYEKLEELIKSPSTNVNIQDNFGWVPLHESAKYNAIECLKLLIKYRLSPLNDGNELKVNIPTYNGITPLMVAISAENMVMIEELLRHGAGVTIYNKSDSGQSALDLAENNNDIKTLLLTSWNTCVTSYKYLNMTNHEIILFHNLLVSYCRVYHFKNKFLNQENIARTSNYNDTVLGYDQEHNPDENLYLNELFKLVEKLVNSSANVSEYLSLTFVFLKIKLNK